MTAATAARLEALGDRLNPIAVKELRRGLRTKLLFGSFQLQLAMAGYLALTAVQTGSRGDELFTWLIWLLAAMAIFVVPFSAFGAFARERRSETWSAVLLTGLTPRALVSGRLTAALVQSLLYVSAIAPFLYFAWILEGLALVSIFVAIAFLLVVACFATCAMVALAAMEGGPASQGARRFAALGLLLAGVVAVCAVGEECARRVDDDVVAGLVAATVGLATLAWALLELATAELAPPALFRAVRLRIALAAHLATLALAVTLPDVYDDGIEVAVFVYGLAVLFAYGLYAYAEPTRVDPALPAVLQTGPSGGLVFCLVASILLALAVAADLGYRALVPALAVASNLVLALAVPLVTARKFSAFRTPAARRWVAAGVVVAATVLLPMAVAPLVPARLDGPRYWARAGVGPIAQFVLMTRRRPRYEAWQPLLAFALAGAALVAARRVPEVPR